VTPGGVRESRWRGNERSAGNVRAKTRGALTFAAATSPGEPAPRPVRTPAGAALAGVRLPISIIVCLLMPKLRALNR
jgi:hypothetical protein